MIRRHAKITNKGLVSSKDRVKTNTNKQTDGQTDTYDRSHIAATQSDKHWNYNIYTVKFIRHLGIHIDNHLTIKTRALAVASSCF